MCQLQKQYNYFKHNKSRLLAKYNGLILVISDDFEVHAFSTMSEAYTFGAKTFGLGHFMIQKCSEEADKVQILSNIGIKADASTLC